MSTYDLTRDEEPDSKSRERPLVRRRRPVKAIEDLREMLLRDADPKILDFDRDIAGMLTHSDDDPVRSRRILDRVRQEIRDHLTDAVSIRANRPRAADFNL